MVKRCQTCNREVVNDFVEFKCPSCANARIVRCIDCEQKTTPYACSECGFKGP